jgi:hypothetical protein
MADKQMTLTVKVTGGNFTGLSAQDSDGRSYDVSLKFSPKSPEPNQELLAEAKAEASYGYWCCNFEENICYWISNAPPCPDGLTGLNTIVDAGE